MTYTSGCVLQYIVFLMMGVENARNMYSNIAVK
jgi:hypothetical protein